MGAEQSIDNTIAFWKKTLELEALLSISAAVIVRDTIKKLEMLKKLQE